MNFTNIFLFLLVLIILLVICSIIISSLSSNTCIKYDKSVDYINGGRAIEYTIEGEPFNIENFEEIETIPRLKELITNMNNFYDKIRKYKFIERSGTYTINTEKLDSKETLRSSKENAKELFKSVFKFNEKLLIIFGIIKQILQNDALSNIANELEEIIKNSANIETSILCAKINKIRIFFSSIEIDDYDVNKIQLMAPDIHTMHEQIERELTNNEELNSLSRMLINTVRQKLGTERDTSDDYIDSPYNIAISACICVLNMNRLLILINNIINRLTRLYLMSDDGITVSTFMDLYRTHYDAIMFVYVSFDIIIHKITLFKQWGLYPSGEDICHMHLLQ